MRIVLPLVCGPVALSNSVGFPDLRNQMGAELVPGEKSCFAKAERDRECARFPRSAEDLRFVASECGCQFLQVGGAHFRFEGDVTRATPIIESRLMIAAS